MHPTHKKGEIVRLSTLGREEVVLVRFWESDGKQERWEVKDDEDKIFPAWIPRKIRQRRVNKNECLTPAQIREEFCISGSDMNDHNLVHARRPE